MKKILLITIALTSLTSYAHESNKHCTVKSACISDVLKCKEYINPHGTPYWMFRLDYKIINTCFDGWEMWDFEKILSENFRSESKVTCEWKKQEQTSLHPNCN